MSNEQDFEAEIAQEAKTLVPKVCVCGEHEFSVDEIQMGSVCPQCFANIDGERDKSIQERRDEHKGKVVSKETTQELF